MGIGECEREIRRSPSPRPSPRGRGRHGRWRFGYEFGTRGDVQKMCGKLDSWILCGNSRGFRRNPTIQVRGAWIVDWEVWKEWRTLIFANRRKLKLAMSPRCQEEWGRLTKRASWNASSEILCVLAFLREVVSFHRLRPRSKKETHAKAPRRKDGPTEAARSRSLTS